VGRAVVVIRGGALGDHVLSLPIAAQLRRAYTGCPLIWIGHRSRGWLARPDHLEDADGLIGRALYGSSPEDLPERIRSARLILIYASQGESVALHLRGVCQGKVINWDPRICDPRSCDPRSLTLQPPPAPTDRHVVEHLVEPLFGQDTMPSLEELTPRFMPTADETTWATQQWTRLGINPSNVILIHAGSGGREKCWPVDRFVALGRQLEERGHSIVYLGGPVEAESSRHFDVLHRWPSIAAEDPIRLAALLASVRYLIGNDSGPGHLAAAVGTPTLSLFGPTDPGRWRPLGPQAVVVRSPSASMSDLDVNEVLAKALYHLSRLA
jgi:ADP-heptose:LPS heptosyltransferase